VSQSAGNTVLTIKANALQFDTEYNILVKVFNSASSTTTPGEKAFVFTTFKSPQVGELTVDPSFGDMFETIFTINMSGYSQSSDQPL
jgi:hypothetical protein